MSRLSASAGILAPAACFALLAHAATAEPPCASFVGPERVHLAGVYSLAVADFNLDGLPDIATSQQGSVSVALSTPGQFDPPSLFDVDIVYAPIVAGDFTGDGKPDVVIANVFGQLYLMRGNGDGTLQPLEVVGSLGSPTAFVAADIDGDGALDLVALAASFGTALLTYRGHDDGTFDDPVSIDIDAYAAWLDVGDVNGDGRLDAVVSGLGNESLTLFLGTDQATFVGPTVLVNGTEERAASLADVNGDGKLDILTVESFFLAVRLGHGDGTFDETPIHSSAPPSPARIAPADFDGDGIVDLAVLDYDANFSSGAGLELFHGIGDGTFRFDSSYVSGSGNSVFSVADFDGDGHPDLVLPTQDAEVWVMRGREDGTIRGVPTAMFGSPSSLLVSDDFDEDGRPDLAAAGYNPQTSFSFVSVATSGPGQSFVPRASYPSTSFFQAITTGDYHGSGHVDIALAAISQTGATLAILPGHGDGTFGPFDSQPPPLPVAQSYLLASGRFDAGTTVDVAVVTTDLNYHGVITVLLGNGDGTFAVGPTTLFPIPIAAMAAADLDGDGILDLAVATSGPTFGKLYPLHGNGDGTFTVSSGYLIGPFPTAIQVADVDDDQRSDLLISDVSSGSVTVLLAEGNGTFAAPYAIGVGGPAFSFGTADFDGDGHVDLVCAIGSYRVSLLLGFGDGTFTAPSIFVGNNIGPVVTGDFDGDGFPDAAMGGGGIGGAAILWNAHVLVPSVSAPAATLGARATLSASADHAAVAYQWRKDGVPLSDGGSISGSRAATLTIDPVSFADAGSYDVIVSDSCRSVTSDPATLSVEFADVAVSSPFHDDILTVATAGIAAGCGGGNYCPTSPVRRDQMAVFLLRSEHGPSYVPPACSGVFPDVPCPSPFADWVEQLAAEGVTGGCGGGNYCPDQSVTRAQMAVFLLKTSQGSSYVPPGATGIFGDVPVGSFAADFVEDLYSRGITGGCSVSPLLYCPNSSVLRQQMATFLVRTFFGP